MEYRLLKERGACNPEMNAAPQQQPPTTLNPPRHLLELVPTAVAQNNKVLPIAFDGNTVTLATADPGNLLLRDKLSFILNKNVKLIAAPHWSLAGAINRHYPTQPHDSEFELSVNLSDTAPTMTCDSMLALSEEVDIPASEALRRSRPAMRLGEIGRNLACGIAEFKQGVKGLEDHEVDGFGIDTNQTTGKHTMFHYIIEEGQRVLMRNPDGSMETLVGPKRVRSWRKEFRPMQHFVAHPGEFLIVRYRDGRQEHLPGPADVWLDPRVHLRINREDALQIAAKEAVVVYSRNEAQAVTRRIVHGPTLFVPAPGEWLHTFEWHGSDGGSQGVKKTAKGLVFQKLWLMPDQMYHDVSDVRTADDAVLTIRLMLFFELLDIEKMLDTTHDPIGDFINAATSDVVDYIGRHSFESFKKNTGNLNELETYRQLTGRAGQCGYRINKVVYRGYGAPDRLQAMHDQAIEARTKLELDRETEQQAQQLEDFRLNAQLTRAARRRTEQSIEVESELEMTRKRQEADLRLREAGHTSAREQKQRDAEMELAMRQRSEQRQREHLSSLRDMGVDLTAYLTQSRADRVIELRGGTATHVHIDPQQEEKRNHAQPKKKGE